MTGVAFSKTSLNKYRPIRIRSKLPYSRQAKTHVRSRTCVFLHYHFYLKILLILLAYLIVLATASAESLPDVNAHALLAPDGESSPMTPPTTSPAAKSPKIT